MCCIIHRPKGAPQIKEEYIRSIIIWNEDGWGISYHNGNNIIISKSLDMKKAISKIRDLEKKDVEFLFHARYATHGKKDLINCHPYQVKPGALFHNGTINTYIYDEDKSDTWHFAKLLNKRIKNSFYEDVISQFTKLIGQSRLALMKNNGDIIKTGKWEELDGCSYSKLNWLKSAEYYNQNYNNYNYNNDYTYKNNRYNNILNRLSRGRIINTNELKELSQYQIESMIMTYPKAMANTIYMQMSKFPLDK